MAILSQSEYAKIDNYYYGRTYQAQIAKYLDEMYYPWRFSWSSMACDDGYGAEIWYSNKVIAYFFASNKELLAEPTNNHWYIVLKHHRQMLADAILTRAELEGRV